MNINNLPFTPKINFITMFNIFKRIFCKKPEIIDIEPVGKKYLLSIAINKYPNPANELNGCLQDQSDILNTFNYFDMIEKLSDSEATKKNILNKINTFVSLANKEDILIIHYSGHGCQVPDKNGDESDGYDEAIYVYDGPIIDDELNLALSQLKDGVHCLVLLDSCFSGSATRSFTKGKFIELPHNRSTKNKAILISDNMKWDVISGCSENETSADAYISGKYHGAFTYYLLESIESGQTVKQWYESLMKTKVVKYQHPTLEGNNIEFVYY